MLHLESRINWSHSEPLKSWLDQALVTVSPDGDYILMSGRLPEPSTFLAKLKKEPINQYIVKPLNISLDMDEQVTSLLCLPIMSTQKTALGSVDWTVFVVGFSSGYVKFYAEQSNCLLSLKFCDESILSVKCQTRKVNTNARSESHFATLSDEILIVHKTNAIVLDGITLFENLRIAKGDIIRNGLHYEPAYNLKDMPSILCCYKLNFDPDRDIIDAELLGTRLSTTFDSLKAKSINPDGIGPKAYARTFATIGSRPFLTCYRESPDVSSHSYTEIIGSLLTMWNRTSEPSRYQMNEISKSTVQSFFDRDRKATSIVASPDKRLMAITDDFGRVLLVDVTNMLIVRMWKGYRSAQCGWVEVKKDPEIRNSPHATFLVIYAPKRGLLEVWASQRGPRIAVMQVGKNCKLIYTGYKMLNIRIAKQELPGTISAASRLVEQSYASHCYILDGETEILSCLNLPYTYSLYKQGDFKSRDKLLISELSASIEQDTQTEIHSEIIHRLSLSDSIEIAIEMVALNLKEDEVLQIMENLINKTMRNYDNHPGETITTDDKHIIDLCKRVIRLCALYGELSELEPRDINLPEVNKRLVDQYEEHPKEVDEFAKKLGWSAQEVLRYLSLSALERSLMEKQNPNPWPNLGEPLTWQEFVKCFDILSKSTSSAKNDFAKDQLAIRLKRLDSAFLISDQVLKTSLFLYNRISETYYQITNKTTQDSLTPTDEVKHLLNCYNYIEPTSRMALLIQFWLSTGLCRHWKMWSYLQAQVNQISDELSVVSIERGEDSLLVDTWKRIYHLILESDHLYAGLIATASLRAVTLVKIQDNEKREKLAKGSEYKKDSNEIVDVDEDVDWEMLCIDAERMSIVGQQLEDIFLLSLILKYSTESSVLVSDYQYRIGRISVANILRAGPTIISDLIAQWIVKSRINLKIISQMYGNTPNNELVIEYDAMARQKMIRDLAEDKTKDEHAKELLHHLRTAFPHSLEPDVLAVYCIWELCTLWSSGLATCDKLSMLSRTLECLRLIRCIELAHKLSTMIYKTFFQFTFERLVSLVESNSTLVTMKTSRMRDTLTRRELKMSEDCLDDFVQFCLDLTEFMMQSMADIQLLNSSRHPSEPRPNRSDTEDDDDQLGDNQQSTLTDLAQMQDFDNLLKLDNWWNTSNNRCGSQYSLNAGSDFGGSEDSSTNHINNSTTTRSLVRTTINCSNLFSMDILIELNKLATLMNLIFKLKIVKAFPKSLIGEESRQILQLDLRQQLSPPNTTGKQQMQARPAVDINDLRRNFSRKCILSIVSKLNDITNEFDEISCKTELKLNQATSSKSSREDIFSIDKKKKSNASKSSTKISISEDADDDQQSGSRANNDIACADVMRLFSQLLTFTSEWLLDRDEMHLELVFELYRCNHDKLGAQMLQRIVDQQTLAKGLLKIASQRVLVLAGLSPQSSGSQWRLRAHAWSIFAPNLTNWLKSIQSEEMNRQIAALNFSDTLRVGSDTNSSDTSDLNQLGLYDYVLQTLRLRTKIMLDKINNQLTGPEARLSRELLEALDSTALPGRTSNKKQ